MKKLGLLAATAVAAISFGSLTAGAVSYVEALTLAPSTVTPGGTFTATFTACVGTETVAFEVAGTTVSATCGSVAAGWRRAPEGTAFGSASATLTAPTAPGEYTVTATGATSGNSDTATLTVAAAAPGGGDGGGGALPATGSDSLPTAQIAAGLVAAGIGLGVVGGVRRRRHSAA